ncbi:hypothetical protein HYS00_02040 [Candidatus Microgenomates bacterium]|nr:hypothetical protein [Candidatus Microgenomates bacterium]
MSKLVSILVIVVMGILFYGITLRGVVGNYTTITQLKSLEGTSQSFESSHERASYAEMLMLRKSNTVELSDELRDFGAPDIGVVDGKYYSYFPPGMSLLIRPFFEMGFPYNLSLLASFSVIPLMGIATMILIYLIGKDVFSLSSSLSMVAVVIFAFATTSWNYIITLYQHIPAAFFAMLMFYGVSRYRARGKFGALWATIVWFTYGISIMFDYPNGVLLAPFIVYYLLSTFESLREEHHMKFKVNPSHLLVALWFFIAVAIHLVFNLMYMNSPFAIRQFYDRYDPGYEKQLIQKQAKQRLDTVTSENVPPPIEERTKLPFVEEFFVNGLYTLLLAPDKGIFYFSPVLLFALWGLYYALRHEQRLEHAILTAFIAINIFLYASFPDPYGGWAFGPRYLIPCITALALYCAFGLKHLRFQFVKVAFYVLFLASLSISAAGALTTNKVPPQIEAQFLKLSYYNYALNFHLLDTQKTGSFLYNTYLIKYMKLSDLYVLIVISLGLFMYLLLFVTPLLFKRKK